MPPSTACLGAKDGQKVQKVLKGHVAGAVRGEHGGDPFAERVHGQLRHGQQLLACQDAVPVAVVLVEPLPRAGRQPPRWQAGAGAAVSPCSVVRATHELRRSTHSRICASLNCVSARYSSMRSRSNGRLCLLPMIACRSRGVRSRCRRCRRHLQTCSSSRCTRSRQPSTSCRQCSRAGLRAQKRRQARTRATTRRVDGASPCAGGGGCLRQTWNCVELVEGL